MVWKAFANAFPMHIFDMHIYMHIGLVRWVRWFVRWLLLSLIVIRDTPNTLRPLNGTFRVCVIHYTSVGPF